MAVLPLVAGWKRLPAVVAAVAACWALPASAADEPAEKSAGDYFVRSLPGAPDTPLVKMHAGYDDITRICRNLS